MRIAERHTEPLPSQLDDKDLLNHCRSLQEIVGELTEMEAAHKLQKETMKGELAEVRTRYAEILKIVKSGSVERHVEVQTEYDVDRKRVIYRRLDTGQVLRERGMSDAELTEERARQAQADLPLPPVTPPAPVPVDTPEAVAETDETVEKMGLRGQEETSAPSKPLLQSCEACSHPLSAHDGPTGGCLIVDCQCAGFLAFEEFAADRGGETNAQ